MGGGERMRAVVVSGGSKRTVSRKALLSAIGSSGALGPPPRDLVVDVGFAVVMALIAAVGFRPVYGGVGYLAATALGALAAAGTSYVTIRRGWGALVALAATVASFLGLSGLVLSDQAIAGVVPSLGTLSSLLHATTKGWAEVLTVQPPVGSAGDLLALPYLCAFVAVASSLHLSRLHRASGVLVAPLFVSLCLSVLVGTHEPALLLVQGGGFVAAAAGWLSLREARGPTVIVQTGGRRRMATGVVMVLAVVPGAVALERVAPVIGNPSRVVLRDQIVPPFDPRAYPSPLSGFRNYAEGGAMHDSSLLSVSGVPDGQALRIAVMDDYDGVVWRVSSRGASSGYFTKVGANLSEPTGATVRVTVEAGDLRGVWVPLVGDPVSIEWQGPRARAESDAFRYNRGTRVGALPIGLASGDRYVVETMPVPPGDAGRLQGEAVDPRAPADHLADLPDVFKAKAVEWAASGGTPAARAANIAAHLRNEGSKAADNKNVAPGHSLARLGAMVADGGRLEGDDEQFAALMALLARALGMPSRVVLGVRSVPGSSGTIKGSDVRAWAEIDYEGVGWVPYDATPDQERELQKPQQKNLASPAQQPPPPVPYQPPRSPEEEARDASTSTQPKGPEPTEPPGGLPVGVLVGAAAVGAPLLLLLLFASIVLQLKVRRQQRRRTVGPPAERVAGGWQEIMDLARDLGEEVPARSTRREIATVLTLSPDGSLPSVAAIADDMSFGADEPTDLDAEQFWSLVERELAVARAPLTPWQRWRARLRLESLRASSGPAADRRRARRAERRRREEAAVARAVGSDGVAVPEGDRVPEVELTDV